MTNTMALVTVYTMLGTRLDGVDSYVHLAGKYIN